MIAKIFALKNTGATRSKHRLDFCIHPGIGETVYPTCLSQLRSPHFMNFIANHAHITCTAVNSNKNFLTLKFLKTEFSLCQQNRWVSLIRSLADKQLLKALQVSIAIVVVHIQALIQFTIPALHVRIWTILQLCPSLLDSLLQWPPVEQPFSRSHSV